MIPVFERKSIVYSLSFGFNTIIIVILYGCRAQPLLLARRTLYQQKIWMAVVARKTIQNAKSIDLMRRRSYYIGLNNGFTNQYMYRRPPKRRKALFSLSLFIHNRVDFVFSYNEKPFNNNNRNRLYTRR
jgi:hypothetical protein